MKQYIYHAYGLSLRLFHCDAGEGIPWHTHQFSHTHSVVRGKTKCEIEDMFSIEMTPDTASIDLPANVPHQLTAIEPNTIFMHINKPDTSIERPAAKNGGVMLHTGVIVYDD